MIPTRRHLSRKLFASLVAGSLAACVGCGPDKPPELHPVWPPPPAPPRIEHLKNIRTVADLARPSWFRRVVRLIAGDADVALIRPHGVAVQAGRRVFVTDQERQAVIVFDLKSAETTVIDRVEKTFLVSPVGVAVCGELVAVSDSALKAVHLLQPDGKLVKTLSRPGGFQRPTGLACDAEGERLYVVDTLANEVCVFEVATGRLIRRYGSPGTGKGQFHFPTHIALDRSGRTYVTDSLNFRVQVFDPDGKYLFHLGKHGDATGHLSVPKGLGVDSFGHIYVVDSHFGAVQVFDQNGAFLLAIGATGKESGEFQIPAGLAVDAENRIYVCDSFNGRVQLLKYVGGQGDEERPTNP